MIRECPSSSNDDPRATLHVTQVVRELSISGGAWRVAWELAQALSRAGIPNLVVTSEVGFQPCDLTEIEILGRWLSLIPATGLLQYPGQMLRSAAFTMLSLFALRTRPGSVVISHGEAMRGDAVIIHAVNAENLAEKRHSGSWRWLLNPMHLWVAWRDHLMIKGLKFRMFVPVSRRTKDELRRHYAVPDARIRVIPNGVDIDRFRLSPEAGAAVRSKFGIPPDAKVLLFIGHEFQRKGLAQAIAAVDRLPQDVWLLVVGRDNIQPYLRIAKRANARIVFCGAQSDVIPLYSAANALILPTSYETFSLVCMEAMACGLPVYATAVGGIEDYLQDDVNGFTITRDPDDIAAVIGRTLFDDQRLARIGAAAQATARQYQWDTIAAQYIELARSLQAPRSVDAGSCRV